MNACKLLLENHQLVYSVIGVLYAADKILETWLGKTDKTEAGSVLELLWNQVKPKSPEDKNGKGI